MQKCRLLGMLLLAGALCLTGCGYSTDPTADVMEGEVPQPVMQEDSADSSYRADDDTVPEESSQSSALPPLSTEARTIDYKGSVSVDWLTASSDAIYLLSRERDGGSGILKMKPGEADGEVLQVTAPDGMVFSVMTTDEQGNLYVVAADRDIEAVMRDDEVVCPTEHCEVWRVSPSGEVAAKLDISEYVKQEVFSPRMIAVAGNGDIYLSTQNDGTAVLAFDAEGNFLNKISYDYKVYTLRTAMGRGRDGKVYAVLWDSIANDGTSVIVELDADLSGEENHMVVLDAGHGGEDGGTVEQAATEKEINLAVVLKLKELLEEQGIRVVLTRDKDIFMKLEERVQIANGEKADLFISIHCNYYEKDSSIYGLECYYCKSGEEGKHYAERIMETIEESKNIVSRNVKPADYYILKNTTVPAVLVEIGYLSNYNERNQLMSEEYQEKLAGELVKGIVKGMEEKTG